MEWFRTLILRLKVGYDLLQCASINVISDSVTNCLVWAIYVVKNGISQRDLCVSPTAFLGRIKLVLTPPLFLLLTIIPIVACITNL